MSDPGTSLTAGSDWTRLIASPGPVAAAVLALMVLACSRVPEIPVEGSLAGQPVSTTVDSSLAKYYLENYLPGNRTDSESDREINDILRSEDVQKAFAGQGMDPASSTPDAFGRLVAKDADRWAALIKIQGIKAE